MQMIERRKLQAAYKDAKHIQKAIGDLLGKPRQNRRKGARKAWRTSPILMRKRRRG